MYQPGSKSLNIRLGFAHYPFAKENVDLPDKGEKKTGAGETCVSNSLNLSFEFFEEFNSKAAVCVYRVKTQWARF